MRRFIDYVIYTLIVISLMITYKVAVHAVIPWVTAKMSTSAEQEKTHWLTTSSGIRHNRNCRWYKKSQGRSSGPGEGRACKVCGG